MTLIQILSTHRNEFLAALGVSFSAYMIILCMSWSSPALPKLVATDSPIPITADEGSWIVSTLSIGLMLGPLITAVAADRIGRKRTLLFTALPITMGWMFMAFGDSIGFLYSARFLFGLAVGTTFAVSPMYLGEICSQNIRGSAVSLTGFIGKLAFIVMYGMGPTVNFRTLAWIGMSGPVIFILLFIWLPESPYYLLGKGKDTEAELSLKWFRRSTSVTKELVAMKQFLQQSKDYQGSFKELFAPQYRKNLRIICILLFATTCTGVTMILAYAQTIFMKISSDLDPEEMSLVLGIIQALATGIAVVLIDRIGRRPLVLFSIVGITSGLVLTSAYFATASENSSPYLGWMAFIALLVTVISFDVGLFVIPSIYHAEVLPKPVRAYANAASTIGHGAIQFVNLKLFQILTDNAGVYVPFALYGLAGVVSGVLVYVYIPETKGQSLEEIEKMVAEGRVKPVRDGKMYDDKIKKLAV
ncbi:AAEL014968-PA [Aedes aegypti]|uniref:AAEL014968-PA n=1 Tax=Aedes aegypti TaxID=7159 RepID=Q16EY5_AEDAE|nr:AAEL014968-PA [Aedes aegypti]